MFKSVLRRGTGLGISVFVAACLLTAATPAQANERPIDITGYQVSNITVADSNCRNLKITASTKIKKNFVDSFGSVDVTRNGGLVSMLWFEGRNITDRAMICPSFDGLGVYKVGAAEINAEYKYYDSYFKEYMSNYSSYTDNTSKKFHVRGKAKSTLTATRSGSKVTLTAKAQVYAPEKYRYAQYNAKGAKLQVKSGKTWKTLKTVNLSKGKATITVKQSTKKSYRLYVPTATWAASTTTKSVSK
ncbi:hypothetical protein ACIGB6_06320 [Paeniglutamicibacter gangotriensis]|uniref:hypothetical protein n=1 Tax=Paeniglutamicibacter gangotriensis TaxID=254787 RepID=UPI0037CAFBF0